MYGVPCSCADVVFFEGHIEAPMEAVLQAPVAADGFTEALGIKGYAAGEGASLDGASPLTLQMDSTIPMLYMPYQRDLSANQSMSVLCQ